ncbi:recombinase family protein [Streptomyces rectiverticillatus]|uniref:recombinase family protein n=1 Tax=Streptomyces rectiverticillatus TaxID=173860 RepID=UPI0015C3D67F|nr:recombinase family protein [Streptomyces rectiverticillatus]
MTIVVKPLGGYCRISDADLADIRRALRNGDITAEEAAEMERWGVLKQREDLTTLAERYERPVLFYEDNNLSAFKRNIIRPDFKRILRDLKLGTLDGILTPDIDRFARQPKDLEKAIDIYEDSKRHLIFDTLSGQNFDLSTADGRFSARLFVNIANKSSEDTSRRIKRDNAAKAKKGIYHGGTHAFGWCIDDRRKLDPKDAKRVEHAVDGFMAGDKISTIWEEWYEAGVVNPNTGEPFTWAGVKTIIFRPRNFGIRIYQDEAQIDADGNYVMGDWESIFTNEDGTPDIDKYERLMAMKTQPETAPQEKSTVKYLLSRIVRCGRCGYPMVGKPVWVRGKKTASFAYNCNRTNSSPEACGKMGASGPRVDELIQELVWAQVVAASKERRIPQEEKPWEKEGELQDVEEQIKELKELWEQKRVRAASYVTALDDLEGRRTQLKAERAVKTYTPAIRTITPELLKAGWDGISIERQRVIIRSVLKAVIIHPSEGGRGGKFDPSRVEPVFAE